MCPESIPRDSGDVTAVVLVCGAGETVVSLEDGDSDARLSVAVSTVLCINLCDSNPKLAGDSPSRAGPE